MENRGFSRRSFLAGAGAAALSLPFVNVGRAFAADKRPNIVFILTDDQRYDAMSCAGHTFLRTPNLDRIAKEGARFTNAFVTTSLCSPSRASFLTGRYAHSHGIRGNGIPLSDDIPTFPQVLQKAGYDTAFIGKWHMGVQDGPRPGFNRWVSFRGQGVYSNPQLNIDGQTLQVTGYNTDLLTKYAIEWLKQPRQSPFCLYLSYKAVHGPFTPAIRHSKLFSDARIPRAANAEDDLKGKPATLAECQRTQHGTKRDLDLDEFVRNYCRTLVAVDEGVGRVLRALQDMGILDDTIVVFAGDNGYFQGEHGLLDKRWMYEESIRIPLLMRYPRLVKPGTLVDRMVLNVDVCPTFLDLAGARVLEDVHGRSFHPLLQGKTSGWRTDWLYEYFQERQYKTPTIRGVRTDRWKYMECPETTDTSELYDLKQDPGELHNLISDKGSAKVLADMRERLRRLVKETGFTG